MLKTDCAHRGFSLQLHEATEIVPDLGEVYNEEEAQLQRRLDIK